MLVDASTLPPGFAAEADLCIVGAGPAGITLARELARSRLRVCVLESGGGAEAAPADLVTTEPDPGSFQDPTGSRQRRFGGNASLWAIPLPAGRVGVRLAPFDPIDFEPREWLPYSGWPFDRSALDPFYERAQAVCQAGPYRYDAPPFTAPDAPALELDPDRVRSAVFQIGPRDLFYGEYRDELAHAAGVTVYTRATAVELETDPDASRVTGVRARTPSGELRCRAARVVLAMGAIENARLLLLSDRAGGLGNGHDLVGRFFMDHPVAAGGTLVPHSRGLFDRTAFYDLRHAAGAFVVGRLEIAAELRRREELQGVSSLLFPRGPGFDRDVWAALLDLSEALRSRDAPRARDAAARSVAHPLRTIALLRMRATRPQLYLSHFDRSGWSRQPGRARRLTGFEVIHQVEQAPDPENRVTLGDTRDSLGLRRARLSTRWAERDARSVTQTRAILAEEAARAGVGRLTPVAADDGAPSFTSVTSHHHMGTTRMHRDPRHGVVDADCRVHDVANLYVTGGSVFPTGSYANPTLTIVAMALRLADHLRSSG